MNSQLAAEVLTKENFITWLKGKPADEIIGEECRSLTCPISKFFSEVYGIQVHVGNWFDMTTIQVVDDKETAPMPDWAYEFVKDVDDSECSVEVFLSKSEADRLTKETSGRQYIDYEECKETDEHAFFDDNVWVRAYTLRPSAGKCLKVLEAL